MSGIIASYDPDGASGISYIDNEEYSAILQTFSMPEDFTIDQIDVKVCRLGTPGNVYVTLRTYTGGILGAAIVEPYFNGNAVTEDIDGEWVALTFGAVALSAGTYAIGLGCAGASSTNRIWWAGVLGDGYTNGDGYSYYFDGEMWSLVNDNADYAFKAYGPVFAPPRGGPTTKRLVAIAKNALWYESI